MYSIEREREVTRIVNRQGCERRQKPLARRIFILLRSQKDILDNLSVYSITRPKTESRVLRKGLQVQISTTALTRSALCLTKQYQLHLKCLYITKLFTWNANSLVHSFPIHLPTYLIFLKLFN